MEKELIIKEWRKRRNRVYLFSVPAVLGIIYITYFVRLKTTTPFENWIAGASIVFVIIGSIFSIFAWRCPACNKLIKGGWGLKDRINPDFCSECGVELLS